MNLQAMNLHPLLRGEWRAVRRTSIKLMHRSFSTVGVAAVVLGAALVTHPEYARTVGNWMSMQHQPASQSGQLDAVGLDQSGERSPFVGRVADRTEEASRLLGLMSSDLSPPNDDSSVTMRKVSGGVAADARADASDVARADTGPTLTKEEREVSRYISRKYRVNNDAISLVVDAAYATGKDLHIDPILLLAVTAIESGFNPFAESTAGASGLMQLMSKVHRDKLADFGGANIALNPVANLRVGAVVLKDCIRRGGSVADGLRLYVGAGSGDDNGYGARVLQERERILQAVRGPVRAHAEPRIELIPAAGGKASAPARAADAKDSEDKPEPNKVVDVIASQAALSFCAANSCPMRATASRKFSIDVA